MVTKLRKMMPAMATVILALVYIVSAGASGIFLKNLMAEIAYGGFLAVAIGVAIQFARGTLVFFPQLNPSRPSFSYTGEWIAVGMGIVSIAEIVALVQAANLAMPVAISLSVLMGMGVLVEIFLLREIRFSTESELMSNEAGVEDLRKFYEDRVKLKMFLDELSDIEARGSEQRPTTTRKQASPTLPESQTHSDNHGVAGADELKRIIEDRKELERLRDYMADLEARKAAALEKPQVAVDEFVLELTSKPSYSNGNGNGHSNGVPKGN